MAYTTIDDPSQYFHTQLYTGSGSSGLSVTNDANAGDFSPDWLWLKPRSVSDNHTIFDSSRGFDRQLKIATDDEDTHSPARITRETDGFDVDTTDQNYNQSSATYVAWQWKVNAGSRTTFTESSNNPGGGRQVNQTAGISIIDYTGTGGNGTVAHGLSDTPNLVLVKARDTGTNDSWFTHWTDLLTDAARIIYWNNQDGEANNASAFNSTKPSSSNVTIGTNSGTNTDGKKYIMYCIQNIRGYSKVGRYVGNGSSDYGTFVNCGFAPQWLYVRRFDSGDNGQLIDRKRNSVGNTMDDFLIPDTSAAETSHANNIKVDFLSNGFRMRQTNGIVNANGGDYVYWAYAQLPQVSSDGIPVTAK